MSVLRLLAALALLTAAALVLRPSVSQAAAARLGMRVAPTGAETAETAAPAGLVGQRAVNAAATMVALAAALLVSGPPRYGLPPLMFLSARWLLHRLPAAGEPLPSAHLLASAAELLAACLEAGAVPATALAVTGACLPAPLGAPLSAAGQVLSSGGDIEQALPVNGPLAALGAVFRRSSRTGSAMTDQLIALAEQLRTDDHFERLGRAQRVSVLSALPLGLCLLPAFLLLAVVPAIAGLGAGLLHQP